MKLACLAFATLVASVAACECPDLVHALSNGMSIVASEGDGALALPPCCEDILKYKKQIAKGGFASKHTPGDTCASLTSCDSCTVLSFCRWRADIRDGGSASPQQFGKSGCVDATSISELDLGEYTHECAMSDRFAGAELVKEMDREPFVQRVAESDRATFHVKPRIAYHPKDWPEDFDGLLPPAGCGHGLSKQEMDEKYPSGLPGCGDYVNEGTQNNPNQKTTDIVSDPRLPVETHKPKFPLGANSQLPDDVAWHGGDFNYHQDNAAWVKPDYNHNGCVGGPCDEMSQHSCTGLSCSHIVGHGNEVSDKRQGSLYKHGPNGEGKKHF